MTSTCGGYQILRTLGSGGNAVVKEVEKDGNRYAMKIFEPSPAEKQKLLKSIRDETNLVRDLSIPGIPKTYELQEDAVWVKSNGSQRNVSFLIMELVQGVELIDFLNQAKRQNDDIIRYIFQELGKTLFAIHKSGIAHRDIKPENVLLTRDYQVKIIDFGFGINLAGRTGTGFTSTYLGTPMYMCPEIVNRDQYQSSDADLFALGVTLIVARLVTYPFDNACRDDAKYMKIVSDKTNSQNFWNAYKKAIPGITDEFMDLVTAMIAENPAARPTMAEFLGHPWMRGEAPSQEEFGQLCGKFINQADHARDAEQNANGIDFQIPSAERNRRGGEGEGPQFNDEFFESHTFRQLDKSQLTDKFFVVNTMPLDVMSQLYELISDKGFQPKISSKSWKIKFEGKVEPKVMEMEEEKFDEEEESKEEVKKEAVTIAPATAALEAEIYEVEEGEKYLVNFRRKYGSVLVHGDVFNELKEEFTKQATEFAEK